MPLGLMKTIKVSENFWFPDTLRKSDYFMAVCESYLVAPKQGGAFRYGRAFSCTDGSGQCQKSLAHAATVAFLLPGAHHSRIDCGS
jgi:hypothetical protein